MDGSIEKAQLAWQPLTARGVAAFAGAVVGRMGASHSGRGSRSGDNRLAAELDAFGDGLFSAGVVDWVFRQPRPQPARKLASGRRRLDARRAVYDDHDFFLWPGCGGPDS